MERGSSAFLWNCISHLAKSHCLWLHSLIISLEQPQQFRAGKGKQWHQISAHIARVWAQVEIARDIPGGFYSACAWCLQNKEYPVSGTEFVADLEEKFQINPLIRTATDLFTSMPLTHLFLMKPWKRSAKPKCLQSFSVEPNPRKLDRCGQLDWGWW